MTNTNPFTLFNELTSTGDLSYFKDPIKALCPLDDQQELNNIGDFQEMLYQHNSGKVFDKMTEAIWKNSPVVYIPRSEFHPDVIDELIDAKFNIVLSTQGGLYISFSYKPYATCENFTIAEMFNRAFTTRSSLPGIFHQLLIDLMCAIYVDVDNTVEYYPKGDYINLEIVKRIVSTATNFPTQIKDKKLVVTWNPLPENASHYFTSVVFSSKKESSYYDQLLQAATERKHNMSLYCNDVNMRNMLFKSLKSDGFVCEKCGSSTIEVEWGNCGTKSDICFSYDCWIRYNTVSYYRICAATITRTLHEDPECAGVILSSPKKPIDEEFFIEYFNERQSYRCNPIEKFGELEHAHMVTVKPEYSEKVKKQLKNRSVNS